MLTEIPELKAALLTLLWLGAKAANVPPRQAIGFFLATWIGFAIIDYAFNQLVR